MSLVSVSSLSYVSIACMGGPDLKTCEISLMQEKESWDMNTQEKIEAAGKKKEEGNVLFKAGKYERASKRYEKVLVKNNFSILHPLRFYIRATLHEAFNLVTGCEVY